MSQCRFPRATPLGKPGGLKKPPAPQGARRILKDLHPGSATR
jgi:hypothetical protein